MERETFAARSPSVKSLLREYSNDGPVTAGALIDKLLETHDYYLGKGLTPESVAARDRAERSPSTSRWPSDAGMVGRSSSSTAGISCWPWPWTQTWAGRCCDRAQSRRY